MQELRLRARHRLIGAVALMVLAVIVFPLLFDTEQRPAVIDAPVVIAGAGHDAAERQPAAAPAARDDDSQAAGSVDAPGASDSPAPAATAEPSQDTTASGRVAGPDDGYEADDAGDGEDWTLGAEVEPLPEGQAAEQAPTATRSKIRVRPAPEPAREATGASGAEAAPARSRDAGLDAEARRALAALQGRSPAQEAPPASPAKQDGRFVVQVGAFSQDEQVRSVQQQIANAGLKSYTQVVQTGAGPRTRVRVGPYDSRDAAERARAALEKGGLPGQVLAH